jgi:hypothetical protein
MTDRLTDEQIAAIRDGCEGLERGRLTLMNSTAIRALATEALESRAEIARLTRERDEARKWERLYEVELSRTMLAFGHRFTLVPPDGGDVRPREAAKSAIEALAAAEAQRDEALAKVARMREALASIKADLPYVMGWNEGFDHAFSETLRFPTMLRKMWSGSEVQSWLDEKRKIAMAGREEKLS